MEVIEVKRGELFAPTVEYYEADAKTPASLVGVSIKADVVDKAGNAVHHFVGTITNAAAGQYTLNPALDTENLPLGDYASDIVYTINNAPVYTESFTLRLVKTYTRRTP